MNSGILFPLSSFPSNHGIGDLGKEAYKVIDALKDSGAQYLQILPFHPSTQANSPYRAVSTYAGDEIYINLDELVREGLLEEVPEFNKEANKVNYDDVRKFKHKYLLEAYNKFKGNELYDEFLNKCPWVYDYALFCTFVQLFDSYDWTTWPDEYKNYSKNKQVDLTKYDKEISYYQFVQFIFYRQWFTFKQYANDNGVKIIGDMPFYVDHGSVEVWLDNQSFLLDDDGKPTSVAGVPPDYFSPTGQYWGNPIYNWQHLEENDFKFWVNRIGWAGKIFDIIRIDHFRAFDSYWDIPATSSSAMDGVWKYAPGYKLFDKLYDTYSDIELVAEDLGDLRKEVIELKNHYHLKGMKVFQFMLNEGYKHLEHSYFYPGTHDNDTIKGWIDTLDDASMATLKWLVGEELPLNLGVLKFCLHANTSDVIIPIWDLLGVDNDQRFNVPGVVNDTNWTYRVSNCDLVIKALDLYKKLKSED